MPERFLGDPVSNERPLPVKTSLMRCSTTWCQALTKSASYDDPMVLSGLCRGPRPLRYQRLLDQRGLLLKTRASLRKPDLQVMISTDPRQQPLS